MKFNTDTLNQCDMLSTIDKKEMINSIINNIFLCKFNGKLYDSQSTFTFYTWQIQFFHIKFYENPIF